MRYKDLVLMFEGTLSKVCHAQQITFPVTLGLNAFRVFLNEFSELQRKKAKTLLKKQKKVGLLVCLANFLESQANSGDKEEDEKVRNQLCKQSAQCVVCLVVLCNTFQGALGPQLQNGHRPRADLLRGVRPVHVALGEDSHLRR